MLKRWLIYLASVLFGLALVGALLVAFVFALLYPTLPSLETLTDYQPKIPLRIVSAEGDLLGEFGEERRAIVKIKEVPDVMRKAILAAEDERFYQHGGVDYLSVMRAALANLLGGRVRTQTIFNGVPPVDHARLRHVREMKRKELGLKEGDFLVIDLAATPLLSRRIERAATVAERLFAWMILGDDRSIAATYLMGVRQSV